MATPPWLEKIRVEMERQKLPPRYVQRLLQELSEHFQDIQEEEKKDMDAKNAYPPDDRLGDPVELARIIGNEYRIRQFSRRHPSLTFAMLSATLLLCIFLGMFLLDHLPIYSEVECGVALIALHFGLWGLTHGQGRLRRFCVGFVGPCMAAILIMVLCPRPLLDKLLTPYMDIADRLEFTCMPVSLVGSLGNELWDLHVAIVFSAPVLVAAMLGGIIAVRFIPKGMTPT